MRYLSAYIFFLIVLAVPAVGIKCGPWSADYTFAGPQSAFYTRPNMKTIIH